MTGNGIIIDKEIEFLQELENFYVDGNCCYGYVDENYEEIIEQFSAISSTYFVTSESHFRPQGHKRYSEIGKYKRAMAMVYK